MRQNMPSNPALPHERSSNWSLTCWFTEKSGWDREKLDNVCKMYMPPDWHLEGQIELGKDSQGEHAQLYLKTPWKRASAVMKMFPKCHVEIARKLIALKQYVHKDDTRVGEFKTIENRSPQWKIVISKFAEWIVTYHEDEHDPTDDRKLALWDDFIRESIKEGLQIDIIGVNPQYRSCVMKYWSAYMYVARQAPLDNGQTDRQTETSVADPPQNILSVESIPTEPCPAPASPVVAPRRRKLLRLAAVL